MAEPRWRDFVLGALERALDVDDADPQTVLGAARLIASGTLVLCVGIGIAASAYVRAGFQWPATQTCKPE